MTTPAGSRSNKTPDLDIPGHSISIDETLSRLGTDLERGLSSAEATERLERFGANVLKARPPASAALVLAHQFASPIVYLLGAAALVSLALGELIEFAAIAVVLLINAAIGFVTEWRAVKSMEALRAMSALSANVRRDGVVRTVPATQLAPGDVVVLEAGDMITADLRLAKISNLEIDESPLTGESLPVGKREEPVAADAPLAERFSMAYKGCAVTAGHAAGIVIATGMQTELGRITQLVESAESARSPLTDKLEELTKALIWLTLSIAGAVAIVGLATGRDPALMLASAIALAVAAIPEGLPIVATLALARGMLRMAKRNALIEQLAAVETLGATTIILTDKTGTLTENRMHLGQLWDGERNWRYIWQSGEFELAGGPAPSSAEVGLHRLFWAAAACTNAELDAEGAGVGDPMEIALLEAARGLGIERSELLARHPRLKQIAFDTKTRRMASIHKQGDGVIVAVKGAPEAVLALCSDIALSKGDKRISAQMRSDIEQVLESMAGQGLRLLAIAQKAGAAEDEPYEGLTLLGIVGLNDPPRTDVAQALERARDAGIKVTMVTGDHASTARAIATEIGLDGAARRVMSGAELLPPEALDAEGREELRRMRIFARVTPEQKLNLIALHQEAGEVVAMTGDGVNDAPALKKADIGIAMGQRGTQVAREAADMVLQDDAFPTIIAAVAEGRAIWANIRRFTVYLLSCNLSEILIVGLAIVVGLPLPLLPLQILFLNLVTDVFPAFALGTIAGGKSFLNRPPRNPAEPLIGPRQWRAVIAHGVVIALATLAALIVGRSYLELSGAQLTTLSFYTLALAQLWHVFNMRNWREGLIRNPITLSPYVWGALIFCLFLIWAAASLPMTALALELVALPTEAYGLIAVASVVPLIAREIAAIWSKWRGKSGPVAPAQI